MKKEIFKYLFILGLAVIVSIFIYFHFEKSRSINTYSNISDRDEYKEISVEDIIEIEVNPNEEMYVDPIIITDREYIEDVFKALGDITIEEETDLRVLDDDFVIAVKTEYGEIRYVFEGNIISLGSKYYEVDGLYRLNHVVGE